MKISRLEVLLWLILFLQLVQLITKLWDIMQ